MQRTMLTSIAAGLFCIVPALYAQESSATAEHKILASEEGVWDADVSVMMPGQDPKEAARSKGVETNHMVAGKWLISEYKGEFFGSKFEGYGVNGYDARKGKYVGTWVDSMSTQIDLLEGTYDEKTKTLTLHADSLDPASGKPMKMRLETQFKDDGTRTFSNYVKMDGQKDYVKFMEIKYTKRSK